MGNYSAAAIELHKKNHGKISTGLKVPIDSKEDLARSYTPGVAAVCEEIVKDKNAARDLTLKRNTIAVVTDGSAVLGLGNIGPLAAIPVMEGKCALFKRFAGLDAFPICLDTQNVDEIVQAVKQISPVFAGINLEDIAAPKCFEVERRLRQELGIPIMHDDQHGTAVVVLAALINALKVKGLAKDEARIVVNGAGAAGLAVSELILEYGFPDVVVLDSHGILHGGREDLNEDKMRIAQASNPRKIFGGLEEALTSAHVFIGVSRGGVLTPELIAKMDKDPVVFALANPIPEIMPEEAAAAGCLVVATGRSDFPNQINNVLAFPGIFRGAVDNGVVDITNSMLTRAAVALAGIIENPSPEQILPDAFDSRVVEVVGRSICL